MSADDVPPGVRERLRKIARLAESGIAGEREEARRLLEILCRKHKVEPETLIATEKKWFKFKIPNNRQWALFKQYAFFVLRAREISFHRPFKAVQMELTEAEAIDLRACYKHYGEIYARDEEDFYVAFVHKYRIFGPPSDEPDDEDDKPIDPERLARLLAMMRGMSAANEWKKPAAALTR